MIVNERFQQPVRIEDNYFNPEEYLGRIYSARDFIQGEIKEKLPPDFKPRVALTLGSGGLGNVADLIDNAVIISNEKIPGFKKTTVENHKGNVILGYISGVPVVVFQGRRHFHEEGGQPNTVIALKNVTFPVYVAKALGADLYIATNGAGGLNNRYKKGDIMIIKDHISSFFPDPLAGTPIVFANASRFQPQDTEYHMKYRKLLNLAAKNTDESEAVHEGIYLAVTGPTFESRPEALMYRSFGADAIGTSTVPEVIIATNIGMDTCGFSLITDLIDADGTSSAVDAIIQQTSDDPVIRNRTRKIIKDFFRLLNQRPEWLLKKEVDSSEIIVDKVVYPYSIVRKDLESRLPYLVGIVSPSDLPYISENVPTKYHRFIIGHEIRHRTKYKNLPEEDACLAALEDELAEVDEAFPYEFNQYVHERHVFFNALVKFYEDDKRQRAAKSENFLIGIKKVRDYLAESDLIKEI